MGCMEEAGCPEPCAGRTLASSPSLACCWCCCSLGATIPLRQSRAASEAQSRECCCLYLMGPAVLACPISALQTLLQGQAELCLLCPRPLARIPAGPGHSRHQHVPTAVTLQLLPGASNSAPVESCQGHGEHRQCGLLRFGSISNSPRQGQPGSPGSGAQPAWGP